uniref:Helicase ATP-binding domain-containing protein n=1 Tax=viral metagenome TaxID=1070528 RepID=A0A6C0HZP7_9ZZZZ
MPPRFFKKPNKLVVKPTVNSTKPIAKQPIPSSIFVPTEQYLETVRLSAYLGKKGYTIPKSILLAEDYRYLKNAMYMKPVVMGQPQEDGAFSVYRENDAKIYLPRFYGIKRYGLPCKSEIQVGDDIDIEFTGELRDYQHNIINTYLDYVEKPICNGADTFGGGGILEVPCGRGKTIMALNIISRVGSQINKKGSGKKTIILVHKEFLMNQWIERISDFLPSARVGKIQANKLEIEGKDIVIGMIQTLFTRDFPANTFDSFGLLIIDEVHHIGSEMFSRTLLKIVTPYVLGISATVERKDKLTKVLYMFIGDKIYSEERKQDDAVTVHGIYYKTADESFNETEYDFKGQPKYSTMISKLCEYGPRSDFIVKVLTDLIGLYGEKGQVMILSHNRSLLSYLYKAIEHRKICSVGFYVGGMKEKDLKDTEEKKVVLATYSMAAEALDIKTLSMLIMASPKKDIEQSVGRILRVKHDNPIVVDIVDSHQLFQNQWQVRKRFYKKCNYGILSIESGNYKGMAVDNGWNRVYNHVSCSINESESSDSDKEKEESINKTSRLANYIKI